MHGVIFHRLIEILHGKWTDNTIFLGVWNEQKNKSGVITANDGLKSLCNWYKTNEYRIKCTHTHTCDTNTENNQNECEMSIHGA